MIAPAMQADRRLAARGGMARHLAASDIGTVARAGLIPAPVHPATVRDRPPGTRARREPVVVEHHEPAPHEPRVDEPAARQDRVVQVHVHVRQVRHRHAQKAANHPRNRAPREAKNAPGVFGGNRFVQHKIRAGGEGFLHLLVVVDDADCDGFLVGCVSAQLLQQVESGAVLIALDNDGIEAVAAQNAAVAKRATASPTSRRRSPAVRWRQHCSRTSTMRTVAGAFCWGNQAW